MSGNERSGRHPSRVVRMRRHTHNGNADSYALGVPVDIAAVIVAAGIDRFAIEMTEEGVLYRPVTDEAMADLPTWLKP